ncbi:MAG TPA: TIGR03808 family TAT-translocated repetitive protein, partial [Xanthobacteraceae bacterium]|nr:TIGR03808 family TAT-translocated repetitive protein [Xanthobacteraceae bacterium]
NIFRAGNVIVRGNRIRNAAFSAVRGNTASNLQIVGNTCTGLGEVALYAEFGFEGALIANNIVDGAALGVSVTNFNQGGRLAVVQGNVIRNLTNKRPPGTDPNDLAGVGIGIEADTVVTGNVVENAPNIGIAAGWGAYLRDVAVNANVIRNADFGITVSVAPGAGAAVIADNLISGVRRGAIVGMEWSKPVTGDLAKDGATRYAQLSIGGYRVR